MGQIIEAFGRYFERFVRWIYPGMLLFVLGHLFDINFIKNFDPLQNSIVDSIILMFVFSFIIYSLHRYVVHEIFLHIVYWIYYSGPGRLLKKDNPQTVREHFSEFRFYKYQKEFLYKRFKKKTDFSDYLLNRWAATHAMGASGEILFVVYLLVKDNQSLNNSWVIWLILIVCLVFFFLGWLPQSLLLTEVETKFLGDQIEKDKNQQENTKEGSVLRTFIQFTALCLTFVAAIFLIKGNLTLSTQDIAKITKTGFLLYNKEVVFNLAGQQADTMVGFFILMISFGLQMANSLWEMRYVDFAVNKNGLIISIVVSALILILAWYISNLLGNGIANEVFKIHAAMQK